MSLSKQIPLGCFNRIFRNLSGLFEMMTISIMSSCMNSAVFLAALHITYEIVKRGKLPGTIALQFQFYCK